MLPCDTDRNDLSDLLEKDGKVLDEEVEGRGGEECRRPVADLVALADGVTFVGWSREFLMEQGYVMGPATIFQDNQASIAMAKRGLTSSGNSRHIKIRYFFVKDLIDSKEVKLEYLSTESMISDLLTKPLQGAHLRRLRDALMNRAY
eukprot:gene28156-33997_t